MWECEDGIDEARWEKAMAADRYINQPDRLLGRTFDIFGGGVVRVDHYFPPTEAHTEALAVRVLDTQDLVRLDARTWRDLETAGAIYEC